MGIYEPRIGDIVQTLSGTIARIEDISKTQLTLRAVDETHHLLYAAPAGLRGVMYKKNKVGDKNFWVGLRSTSRNIQTVPGDYDEYKKRISFIKNG